MLLHSQTYTKNVPKRRLWTDILMNIDSVIFNKILASKMKQHKSLYTISWVYISDVSLDHSAKEVNAVQQIKTKK